MLGTLMAALRLVYFFHILYIFLVVFLLFCPKGSLVLQTLLARQGGAAGTHFAGAREAGSCPRPCLPAGSPQLGQQPPRCLSAPSTFSPRMSPARPSQPPFLSGSRFVAVNLSPAVPMGSWLGCQVSLTDLSAASPEATAQGRAPQVGFFPASPPASGR